MITHTISLPELVWTITTAFGTIFCARITNRAIIDLISLRIRRINSIREYAAITTLWCFVTWTLVEFSFCMAGVNAMTVPNPDSKIHPPAQQYITLGIFEFMSFLLAWAAFTIDRRRIFLVRKLEELENEPYDS